jgi:hypothetical protein
VKSDRFFRWNRRFQHLPYGLENRLKSCIVPLFHRVYFSAQLFVSCEHSAEPDKVRMIAMFTCTARELRSTLESIAMPCSVKA